MGWLKWQPAVGLAVGSGIVGLVWWHSAVGWQRAVATFCRELALVLSLYTIWILAGRLSVVRVDEGLSNGRWVYHAQQTLHLPTEVHLQDWLIDHAFMLVPAQHLVQQFMATFKAFPPRQKAASFTVQQAHDKLGVSGD